MKWIKDNMHLVSVATMLVAFGMGWADLRGDNETVRSEVGRLTERIKVVESIRADETRWIVSNHEKRITDTEADIASLKEGINKMLVMLERIDHRTGGSTAK